MYGVSKIDRSCKLANVSTDFLVPQARVDRWWSQSRRNMVSNSIEELYFDFSGSSDSIRFDTVVGGLNTIPEFLDPQIFGHGREYGTKC